MHSTDFIKREILKKHILSENSENLVMNLLWPKWKSRQIIRLEKKIH